MRFSARATCIYIAYVYIADITGGVVGMIGKMEELVLLAAIRIGPEAVPSEIYQAIDQASGSDMKSPAFGAIYTTLTRMGAKGLLAAGSKKDEMGRVRKTFTVTAEGRSALAEAVNVSHALGAPQFAGALA